MNMIDMSEVFKREGENGNLSSKVNYGYCELLGNEVIQDVNSAMKTFRMAAELHHAGGEFYYGVALSAKATNQTPEADVWFTKCALWIQDVDTLEQKIRTTRSEKKIVKPKVTTKRSFFVPGNQFQKKKEQKELKKAFKRKGGA